MSINKSYAVFGLGRYGTAVAKELANSGAEVLAIDNNQAIINDVADFLPICRCADITDPAVIEHLGISNIDTVIIAMANNLEASVMATALCKEVGVKEVIAKCSNEMHKKILLKVGADKVVFPEFESGLRLAKNLLSSGFVDVIELSKNVSMVEIDVKKEWLNKTLIELNLRKKYGLNVIAIKNDQEVIVNINPETKLNEAMKLIVIANTDKLTKLI
ncbi:MAG: TrkA family potassium uptake protein [Clostridia bacterium]|nr:TrkA family potassium uptake protein [Clostridia bacterium]